MLLIKWYPVDIVSFITFGLYYNGLKMLQRRNKVISSDDITKDVYIDNNIIASLEIVISLDYITKDV